MVMDKDQSVEAWIASVPDITHCLEAANFEVTDIDSIIALTQGVKDSLIAMTPSLYLLMLLH